MELKKSPDLNQSWRDVLPIHPAAELFDRMSDQELKVLAEDIVQGDGLRNPIIIYVAEDGAESLIDGRNRLAALELAGFEIVKNGKFDFANVPHQRVTGVDPYDLAISMNLYRRHLDLAAKRKLIAKLLKLKPEASDRQIAFIVAVSHNTVKVVRRELEARGQIDHVKTRTDTKGRRQPAVKPAVTKGDDEVSAVESAEQRKRVYATDEEPPKPDTTPTAPDAVDDFTIPSFLNRSGENAAIDGREPDHVDRAGGHQGADQHHGGDDGARAPSAPSAPLDPPRMQGAQILAVGKVVPSVSEVERKLTGTEVAAAFNELSKKECAEFFAAVSPAKNCVLRQHFENTYAEIAKLVRETQALLKPPLHNQNDIYKRLARIEMLTDADKLKIESNGKSNAKLNPALFSAAVGLDAGTKH